MPVRRLGAPVRPLLQQEARQVGVVPLGRRVQGRPTWQEGEHRHVHTRSEGEEKRESRGKSEQAQARPNQQRRHARLEAQSEHAHVARAGFFLHVSAPTCMLGRCLIKQKNFCIGAQSEVY